MTINISYENSYSKDRSDGSINLKSASFQMDRHLQPTKLHSIENRGNINEDIPNAAADGPIMSGDYLSKKKKAKSRNKSVGATAGRRLATMPARPEGELSDPETLHDHEE